MKKILLITGNYLPGVKAGGPIQSVKGLIWLLRDKYEVNILTRDRDLGDKIPYDSILVDDWNIIEEKSKIMYVTSQKIKKFKFLKELINSSKYDLIYLQSFFDSYTRSVLLLKKFNLIKSKILLAPRGEFGESALKKSRLKKIFYLRIFKLLSLDKNIIWHATNQEEGNNIKFFFTHSKVYELNNIKKIEVSIEKNIKKKINEVNFIFISRIVDHKNLYFLLERIEKYKNTKYKINLDIYGPLENLEYWKKCEKKIKICKSKNITIEYKGILKNETVIETIKNYHYLILPTKGENFGHIIVESFLSKTPVIISDRTPWKELFDNNVGYDISLENEELWDLVMEEIIKKDDISYKCQVDNIETFYKKKINIEKVMEDYINVIEKIL